MKTQTEKPIADEIEAVFLREVPLYDVRRWGWMPHQVQHFHYGSFVQWLDAKLSLHSEEFLAPQKPPRFKMISIPGVSVKWDNDTEVVSVTYMTP